jgi:steroid delta-isomerase-like uncharacterized protein
MYDINTQTKPQAGSPEVIGAGLLDAWNSHDVEQVMSYYAPNYVGVDVGQATPEHGPDGKRDTVLRYLAAFPDLYFSVESAITQGDMVAVSWIATGTHNGPYMRIPPTGRGINVRGVSMLTIAEGKIAHGVYIWDVAGLLRGIGLLPDL